MARITTAALQAQIAELEAAQQGLVETIDDLRQQVIERDARILHGHSLVRSMKTEIAALREQLAVKPKAVFIKPRTEPKPVVTRFYRGGQLWEKTRVGNVATERVVEPRTEFHVVAGKYDGDEENCKFADVRETREDAEALLATVSDYPWSRIEERAAA